MMTRKADCAAATTAPSGLAFGDEKEVGRYFRNLKRTEISKVYGEDSDNPPVYGYRVKESHWQDTQRGFSVNCAECMCDPDCSIILHEYAHLYQHVAEIDIEELAKLVPFRIVAQYAPLPGNVCHFNIVATEKSGLSGLAAIGDALEELAYPCGKKLPKREEAKEEVKAACDKYHRLVRIHRHIAPAPAAPDNSSPVPLTEPLTSTIEVSGNIGNDTGPSSEPVVGTG
ncbi:hypothetical protein LZC95_48900 [Pendulispora brunnea]|uniref:C2H2-type domain-containing protein n=1 Tax=Pendulispora brunnea TaxID=2905690 RepID=A0ABZ2K6N2_9BACT